jgi:hypothetical protein
MSRKQNLQSFVERALAFAHAALDNPTDERVTLARVSADDALERVRKLELTLGEARQIVLLVAQLRAVLSVVQRRTAPAGPMRAAS